MEFVGVIFLETREKKRQEYHGIGSCISNASGALTGVSPRCSGSELELVWDVYSNMDWSIFKLS
jgi:hypothetical protein